jgi:hypothetical protein
MAIKTLAKKAATPKTKTKKTRVKQKQSQKQSQKVVVRAGGSRRGGGGTTRVVVVPGAPGGGGGAGGGGSSSSSSSGGPAYGVSGLRNDTGTNFIGGGGGGNLGGLPNGAVPFGPVPTGPTVPVGPDPRLKKYGTRLSELRGESEAMKDRMNTVEGFGPRLDDIEGKARSFEEWTAKLNARAGEFENWAGNVNAAKERFDADFNGVKADLAALQKGLKGMEDSNAKAFKDMQKGAEARAKQHQANVDAKLKKKGGLTKSALEKQKRLAEDNLARITKAEAVISRLVQDTVVNQGAATLAQRDVADLGRSTVAALDTERARGRRRDTVLDEVRVNMDTGADVVNQNFDRQEARIDRNAADIQAGIDMLRGGATFFGDGSAAGGGGPGFMPVQSPVLDVASGNSTAVEFGNHTLLTAPEDGSTTVQVQDRDGQVVHEAEGSTAMTVSNPLQRTYAEMNPDVLANRRRRRRLEDGGAPARTPAEMEAANALLMLDPVNVPLPDSPPPSGTPPFGVTRFGMGARSPFGRAEFGMGTAQGEVAYE